jgi:Spy/CpxP family protein refolding chaperone
MKNRLLMLALAVSAAFNLGFIGTYTYNSCCPPGGAELPPCLSQDSHQSPRMADLSERLQHQLEPLRRQQAEETRRLAELIAVAEPDRTAIAACLDRLTASERSIKGLVVETILAQQEELPASQRAVFCNHVRRRLCDPWHGCGAAATDATADRQNQPEE